MEPGKILHELRTGELARTGETAPPALLRDVDATPLWLILLDETYRLDRRPRRWSTGCGRTRSPRSTGSTVRRPRRRRLRRVRAADAARARSTRAGRTRATRIRHRDGALAEAPDRPRRGPGLRLRRQAPDGRARPGRAASATLAERLDARGRRRCARRFDAAFWMEDARSTRWRSTATSSQVGRDRVERRATACGAGSCPPERADAVVDRLLAPDMFSGWGIRTYAAGQAGYNPIGYHTGTVWPHDNAPDRGRAQALRLPRRGGPAGRPDLRGGAALRRTSACPSCSAASTARIADVPVPYPVACSPQAWAAGLARSCSSRRCSACAPTPPRTSWSSIGRSCRRGSAR